MRKVYTPATAALGVEEVLRLLEGRWKLILLFHLFDGKVQRYSDFEKLIPGISQKMLAQQLRQLEADGLVSRKLYPQVPPKVEYRLTDWGQALCPALDAMLKWAEQRDALLVQEIPRDDGAHDGISPQGGPGRPHASVRPTKVRR